MIFWRPEGPKTSSLKIIKLENRKKQKTIKNASLLNMTGIWLSVSGKLTVCRKSCLILVPGFFSTWMRLAGNSCPPLLSFTRGL